MKHVAQFVHSFEVGGAEVLAVNIAGGLVNRGYRCSLWGMAGGSALLPRLQAIEIDPFTFQCPLGVSLKVMATIARTIVRERVDFIVTHHFRQLLHALPSAVLLRKRVVHIEHDYHFYVNSPKHLPLLRFMLRFTSQFVAVSKEVASAFDSGFSGRVRCLPIPNGIDTRHFRSNAGARSRLRQLYSFGEDHLVVGTCARLEPVKQVALLIRGFAEFAKGNSKARLVIVGDGSERAALANLAESLNVAPLVRFAGVTDDVGDYLNMFDIFALTSSNEGLPLALLEAMAVELPVVATNVGSIASVVMPDTGILLPQHTVDQVVSAFRKLEDQGLRRCLGVAARQVVTTSYSQESMIQAYVQLLECPGQSVV